MASPATLPHLLARKDVSSRSGETLGVTADNGIPSECEILINQNAVVAPDCNDRRDRNIGMSVTNACEVIATEVVRRFGLDSEHLIFIEHCPTNLAWRRHAQPG